MKILKKILLVLLIIIVLFLITGIFVKKECTIERSITINKPKQEVFDYIKLLKNQDNFSVWMKMDPDMKKEYTGTDGTIGFTAAWDSERDDVGKGSQTITKIDEGNRIDFALHFIKPREGEATCYMSTEQAGDNQTLVKWVFQSKAPYPFNVMLLIMPMDKYVGEPLEKGLVNLKEILEKK
jgi:hypothetical protein